MRMLKRITALLGIGVSICHAGCGNDEQPVSIGIFRVGMTRQEVESALSRKLEVHATAVEYSAKPTVEEYTRTIDYMAEVPEYGVYLCFNHYDKVIKLARSPKK
jgi:hypothetical protein